MKRNATLDILRAAAIIMVVNCHFESTINADGPLRALQAGGRGVDLFFVLSGWLLGHQLLTELRDTGGLNVTRFWFRRWLRTLPAYYVVLALTLGWQVLARSNFSPQWGYFVFIQNYQREWPYFGVSWSLCVEEHFYLLVAPALLLFFRFPWMRFLIFVLLLLPSICRFMGWYANIAETHVRYDQCAVGVILASAQVFAPRLWGWLCRVAPYLAGGALIALTYPYLCRLYPLIDYGDFGELFYALLFGSFVVLANSSPFYGERLRSRFFRYLADRAYAVYLLHPEGLALAKRFSALPTPVSYALTWGISLLLAEVLYRSIEKPFMLLRERFPQTWSTDKSRAVKMVKGNPRPAEVACGKLQTAKVASVPQLLPPSPAAIEVTVEGPA
jgi:peptidoglycan/LPS O-acetylase OafA/YrhL